MRGLYPPATRYGAEYVGTVQPAAGKTAGDVRWHTEARGRVDACEAGMQEGRFAIACRGEGPNHSLARFAIHSLRRPQTQVPGSERQLLRCTHSRGTTRREAA